MVAGDTQISRSHARVSLVGGGVVAEDLGSTNGTFDGAQRITQPTMRTEGQLLRVGQQILRYERRNRRDVKRAEELNKDLRKASAYVLSLLPPPITTGPAHVEWHFQPSTQLGGDAFGYYWLDSETLIFYLIDVSGHGVGAAMHSVTVMNVLRQRALPGIDFKRAQLLQYDGKPLAQIAYLDPETGPMALCIVASDAGRREPDLESRKGMNVVYWSNATHAFMLIGHAPADRMSGIADAVRGRIKA